MRTIERFLYDQANRINKTRYTQNNNEYFDQQKQFIRIMSQPRLMCFVDSKFDLKFNRNVNKTVEYIFYSLLTIFYDTTFLVVDNFVAFQTVLLSIQNPQIGIFLRSRKLKEANESEASKGAKRWDIKS